MVGAAAARPLPAAHAIFFTLPSIALSALPVEHIGGDLTTRLALPPDEGGFQNDPVLGVVEHLGVSGVLLDVLKVYVGVLAATILFIATNAGVIGASRITYAMAGYRQLPELFRRVHPKFKTPWIALVVFAGIISILTLLPGQVDFLGTMYSFGAMLSFTIAHASIVTLRYRRRDEELVFRGRPNVRLRGVDWPLFAILGALGTGLAWIVVVVQTPSTRYAGLGWLVLGFVAYGLYRWRVQQPLAATVRAPIPIGAAVALEYRRIVVPAIEGFESDEAMNVASGLAAERGARIAAVTVVEIPFELPLDAELPDAERRADDILDEARAIGELYGVDVVTRIVRARSVGRAIVEEAERRQAEIIVIGAPRRPGRRGREIFGETVDYVLQHAPCRVLVAARKLAA